MGTITDSFVRIEEARSTREIDFVNRQMAKPDYIETIGSSGSIDDQAYVFYRDSSIVGFFIPVIDNNGDDYLVCSPVLYIADKRYSLYCFMSMISYLFVNLSCRKLDITVVNSNSRMLTIVNRLGLRKEGVFRKYKDKESVEDKWVFSFMQKDFERYRLDLLDG